MKPQWHFNTRRECDRMRDSANDAFFTAESLENLSEALVREGIQNSLDAAKRSNGNVRQVRVRNNERTAFSGVVFLPRVARFREPIFVHGGSYISFANPSASATALSIALALLTVSCNSASGVESFTQPPPACT